MRKLVLSTQAAIESLSFDIVATPTIASILGAKPLDVYVQGATALTVAAGNATSAITGLTGPFVFSGDPIYTIAGRVVNEGIFAMHIADDPTTAAFSKAMMPLFDATGNSILVGGKELVGFLKVDPANANATSVEYCVDNGNGTFSVSAIPAGVTSVIYQVIKRYNLNDLPEDALLNKKFFHGVIDIDMMNDLNQILKDLYGPGYSFLGTGASALGAGNSLLEQLQAHMASVNAHTAAHISVDTATGLQPNVQLALQQLQGLIASASTSSTGANAALQAEVDAIEAAVGLNPDGSFKPFTGTNYINAATSTSDAIVKLDTEAKLIADLVAANAASAAASSAGIDAEMEKIELGVYGVDTTDGSMPAITGKNYINTATSMMMADALLDAAIKTQADAIAAEAARAVAAEGALQTELDRLELSTGMNADGSFKAYTGTNYMDTATSMTNADTLLDAALKAEAVRAAAAEATVSNALAAHIASLTAHSADHITVVPTGDLKSTNVQAALVELQGDADAIVEALDTLGDEITGWVDNLTFNTGADHHAKGLTYTSHNYITDLLSNGGGMNHTAAISALDNQVKTQADALTAEAARAVAAEGAIQAELDRLEAATGMNTDGSFKPYTGTNYINAAASMANADALLDSALKAEAVRAAAAESAVASNLAAHIASLDAHTAAHIDITAIAGMTATNVQDALAALQAEFNTGAQASALAALQAEVDRAELAAGLNADGTFAAHTTTNYINTATSMFQVDELLDAAIKAVSNNLATQTAANQAALAAVDAEMEKIELGVYGTDTADGSMPAITGTNYINAATSMMNADVLLDAAIKAEAVRAMAAEAALQSSLNAEAATRAAADTAETNRAVTAESALQTAINSIKSAQGIPVDGEILTLSGNAYILLNDVLPGTYPQLVINGAMQTPGTAADLNVNPAVDYAVVDDGTGHMRKIQLATANGIVSTDSAVAWYRKPFSA